MNIQDVILLRAFAVAIAIVALFLLVIFLIGPPPEAEAELIIGTGEPVCECAACIPPEGRE